MVTREVAQPRSETRDRILDAAGQLFAEQGFGGATVEEIARRAGVNKAMLYYRLRARRPDPDARGGRGRGVG